MRRRISATRQSISKLLLDRAAALPPWPIKALRRLQQIRAIQIEDADQQLRDPIVSAPVLHPSARWIGLALVEMFQIEQYEDILAGIRQLFPKMDVDRDLQSLKTYTESSTMRGQTLIGTLRRRGRADLSSRTHVVPTLPTYVDRVELFATHSARSTILLIACATFNDTLDGLMREQLQRPVLPVIEFTGPLGELGFSFIDYGASEARATADKHWFQCMHKDVQDVVFSPYFHGGFFASHLDSGDLPALELYCFSRSCFETIGEEDQIRPWVLGDTGLVNVEYFGNSDARLGSSDNSDSKNARCWRLAVADDLATRAGATRVFSLWTFHVAGVTDRLALSQYVSVIEMLVTRFRRAVYYSGARLAIQKQVTLYEDILREWLVFDRARLERTGSEAHYIPDGFLRELGYLTTLGEHNRVDADSVLRERIAFRFANVRRELIQIKRYFDDALAVRNIRAMHGLTKATLIVSAVAVLITIVPIVSHWTSARVPGDILRTGRNGPDVKAAAHKTRSHTTNR